MQRFIRALALVLLSATAAFPEDARPDKTAHKVGLPIPAYLAVIPTAANNPGRQGAFYKTRVVMHNVTNHDFRVRAMLYSSKGIHARESIPMTAGSYRVWDNFLQEVFNFRGGGAVALIAESAGLQVEDPDDITDHFSVTAEVYTDSENGRFTTTVVNGLIPLIRGETIAVSAGVTVDQKQRVNLGVFNLDLEEPAAVRAEVHDQAGTVIQTIDFEAGPGQWKQSSIRVPVDNGIVWWETMQGAAWLWTVAVDNLSNDGTLTYPIRLEAKP